MMMLNIFNDFCTWWPIWWVVPFLLGILLGRALFAKYRSRVAELENILRKERAHNYENQVALKKCKTEKSQQTNLITRLEEEKKTIERKYAMSLRSAESNVIETSPRYNATSVITTSLGSDKNEATQTKETPKSSKGDFSILRTTNLQVIEGIGPKLETLLKENGIDNWEALSHKSQGELRAMLDKYGSRYTIVDPSNWPKQALLAVRGKWEELIRFQSDNGGQSKLEKILIKLGIQ